MHNAPNCFLPLFITWPILSPSMPYIFNDKTREGGQRSPLTLVAYLFFFFHFLFFYWCSLSSSSSYWSFWQNQCFLMTSSDHQWWFCIEGCCSQLVSTEPTNSISKKPNPLKPNTLTVGHKPRINIIGFGRMSHFGPETNQTNQLHSPINWWKYYPSFSYTLVINPCMRMGFSAMLRYISFFCFSSEIMNRLRSKKNFEC